MDFKAESVMEHKVGAALVEKPWEKSCSPCGRSQIRRRKRQAWQKQLRLEEHPEHHVRGL